MKRILLASASIVAFAGAASAQDTTADTQAVSFGGSAELGFNDEDEDGFYYNAELTVGFLAELDNGLRARVDFTIPISDNDLGDERGGNVDDDFVLAIEAEGIGGLFFGDTDFAAQRHWDPGFALGADGFSEQDNETVLRGDGTFAGFSFSASTILADPQNDQPGAQADDADGPDLDRESARDIYTDQISVGASGEVGAFTMNFAYQEGSIMEISDPEVEGDYDTSNEDFVGNEILGVAAGTTFGGFDVKLAYGRDFDALIDEDGDGIDDDGDEGTNSYGALVRFPVGPLALSASYTFEPDRPEDSYKIAADYFSGPLYVTAYYESEIGDEKYGIESAYILSDTTIIQAGFIEDEQDDDDQGVYASYRQGLGANAYFQISYAEFTDAGSTFTDTDAVDDLKEGTTIALGFEF